jgi:hypothetical protein
MPAHTKPATAKATPANTVIGIDIGKNVFHLIGLDKRGAIVFKAADGEACKLGPMPDWN